MPQHPHGDFDARRKAEFVKNLSDTAFDRVPSNDELFRNLSVSLGAEADPPRARTGYNIEPSILVCVAQHTGNVPPELTACPPGARRQSNPLGLVWVRRACGVGVVRCASGAEAKGCGMCRRGFLMARPTSRIAFSAAGFLLASSLFSGPLPAGATTSDRADA